jgi:hypothetical protein
MMERAGAIVDRALAGESMTEVYSAFARLAVECTRGDAAWVLLERADERFVASHVEGRDDEHDDAHGGGPRPLPGFLRSAELETRLARRPLTHAAPGEPTPYITAPVRLGAEHLGCIVLALREDATRPEDDVRAIVGLAALVAVAHRCRDLHRERRQAHDETVQALTNALRARDEETAGKSQRVASLARELALELGYDPKSDETHHLYHGALLHDIGKLGVPEVVLEKESPLTDAEWREMQRHPETARHILEGIPHLEGAAELIYACRERWDGSGYPRGLTGDGIPLAARIFAVADAWEALTSPRSYGPTLTPEEAQSEIVASAGQRFDPEVVEAFERLAPVWAGEARRRRAAA